MHTVSDTELGERYTAGEDIMQLGRSLGISRETVRCRLHKLGVKFRSQSERQQIYTCDAAKFEDPTPEAMYFAGLLMADGNIGKSEKIVQITLQTRDGYLLTALKEFINYTGIIRHRERIRPNGYAIKFEELRITSPQLTANLRKFGLCPRKSKLGKIPSWIVEHANAEYFFRGLFDGDGCVGIRRGKVCTGKKYATFCGNSSVVNTFRTWVTRRTGLKGGLSIRAGDTQVINYSYNAVAAVYACLYGSPIGPRLHRKVKVFET